MDLLLAEDLSQIDEARPGIAISGKRLPGIAALVHSRCLSGTCLPSSTLEQCLLWAVASTVLATNDKALCRLGCSFSIFDDDGDVARVTSPPFTQRGENFCQATAKVGQLVLDVRRDCLEVDAPNDAIISHFLEMLDQHLLADIGHEPAQLTGAFGAAGQMEEDKRLPLAPEDFKNRFQTASEIRFGHLHLQNRTLTK